MLAGKYAAKKEATQGRVNRRRKGDQSGDRTKARTSGAISAACLPDAAGRSLAGWIGRQSGLASRREVPRIPSIQEALRCLLRVWVADRRVVARNRLDIEWNATVLDLPCAALPGQNHVGRALPAVLGD